MIGHNKKIFLFFLLLSIIYSSKITKADPTILELEPNTFNDDTLDVGSTIDIKLKITNVLDMIAYETSIKWDPEFLKLESYIKGDFLSSKGQTIFLDTPINQVDGIIPIITEAGLSHREGVDGSGPLITFTFSVVKKGSTIVEIKNSIINSDQYVPIEHSVVNSNVNTASEQPSSNAYGPTAIFTPTDNSYFILDKEITLDATASKNGYDTEPSPETVTIQKWEWEIDTNEDGVTDLTYNGKTVKIKPEKIGKYKITLKVSAPDTNPPTSAFYKIDDKVTHTLNVIEEELGLSLNLYTVRGGIGEDVITYGPQELVQLRAEVKLNNSPVENCLVLIDVQTNTSQPFYQRTIKTNDLGIASTEFRLPWTDKDPESFFGTWTIKANVKVADNIVQDTVKIQFKYTVKPLKIWVTDTKNKEITSINIYSTIRLNMVLKNDMVAESQTLISIIFYDGISVPINWNYIFMTMPSKSTISIAVDMNIPSWAFAGTGTFFINIYNRLPNDSGNAYCPETKIPITLTKS